MAITDNQKALVEKYKLALGDDLHILEKIHRENEKRKLKQERLKNEPEYKAKVKLQAQYDIEKYNNNFATVLVNLKEYMDSHPAVLNLDLRILIGDKTQFLVQINDANYIPFGKKNSLSFKTVNSAFNKVQRDLKDVDVLLQFIEPDLMEKMTKIGENEFFKPEEISKIISKGIDDTPFYEYTNIPNDDITIPHINSSNIPLFIDENIIPQEVFIIYEQKIMEKNINTPNKNGSILKI